jgi:hypothetical protein
MFSSISDLSAKILPASGNEGRSSVDHVVRCPEMDDRGPHLGMLHRMELRVSGSFGAPDEFV